ncbi:CDP-diacylglycerol--glycerol-3-phosphate 3-phosphatidyltransferase [Candidatus Methylopumilus turicensis]|uniref:CDP-diacylglycerol--glycerol-3-phosphate 3-phosphatidyltransferase n=1 Tax=Candidatus Methylopumilus turicensis TaxID=1581680 RepID=A0A0B7J0A5_9PROT|nr:CDP-diacylglycerol--glycerol-3-phosphate 3-phosphatidyltransferase [Candidatus Methylopumilus turicensis]CEN56083.1 phosphatidylglycerophosphate synthetase [Candidatus Methylopumilus turicensis]
MFWNLPNSLTMARIILIPVFVGIFYAQPHYISQHAANVLATAVFGSAAITDWLDGYYARKLNQTSAFGAFLDPVADKLMVAAALIVLVEFNRVGALVAFIIIGREIAISALREWMAGIGERGSVAVAMVGKIKTVMQMVAILFLLYFDPILGISTKIIGQISIYVAVILTLVSMAYYLKAAWPQMNIHKS